MTDYRSLVQAAVNADEVWEEAGRFIVYRNRRQLLVSLFDQGSGGSANVRFFVRAEAVDNPAVNSHGNADGSVEGALSNVHWWEFD